MNLKTCQYFLTLAEELNFTRASDMLHITQQSLSGSIRRLEEEYGVELFQRKPVLRLTQAGEAMVFYARQILKSESQMTAAFADLSADCSGHLNLGMSRQRIQVFFPGIWERYHDAHPNVSINLRQSYTLAMTDDILAGKLDMFVGVDVPSVSNLTSIPLASENICCLVSDRLLMKHLPDGREQLLNKARCQGLDICDLKDLPILLLSPDNRIRPVLDRAYDSRGIMPKTVLEASDQSILYQLACEAQGAAFLPPMILFDRKTGALSWPADCHFLMMDSSLSRLNISLVYRNDLILPHYAADMKKAIMQEFHSYTMAINQLKNQTSLSASYPASSYPCRS